MTAKRILLLDTGKEWGGGTNSMIELLKRIDRRRFDITALFYLDYRKGSGATLSGELAAIGIPLRILAPSRPPWWEKPAKELVRAFCFGNRDRIRRAIFAIERRTRIEPMARRIAAEIRAGGYQLLYMNNQPGSNVEGYLAAAETGVPAVQHCRIEPLLTPAVVALTNAHAAKIICVSDGVRDTLIDAGLAVPRCLTVHNGIDCNQVLPDVSTVIDARATWGFPADAILVGTVGQLIARKRVADLIHVVARLRRDQPQVDLRIVVVGEGREAQPLAQLAASLGIANRVLLTGFDPQPLRLVAAMDIFALCSASEGLPRVILEAMLLRRPVIASSIVGSRELVADSETGVLYPCGDIPALTGALARLAGNAALRARMGEAGAQRVREHFSIERYVAGVESALAEVLEARG
jgi:glycosyltransferase involved in cell wall biosynthesis